MKAKNNSITIWRIIFTYMILIFHFDNKYGISKMFGLEIGWYIGVEFFFIVSGYLLYDKIDSLAEKCHSGWDYFVYRYKNIYPYYLGAFIFSFVMYFAVKDSWSVMDMVKFLSNDFFEVFALHGIGLDDGWSYINNTSWFISIMLISGFIIYHCLIKWRDNFVNFVAPLIIMISFSYLYRNMHGIGAVVQIDGLYNHQALMRGLADMCLGIMAARLNHYIRENYKNTKWIRLVGVFGFLFVILCSLKFGNSTTDFLYAMILTVSIGIAFLPSEHKIFQYSWIHRLSGITMCMYFVHDAFRTFIFPKYFGIPESLGGKLLLLELYLITVTVSAFLFEAFIKWGMKQLKRLVKEVTSCEEEQKVA